MTKETITMNQNEIELKAIAKAIGGSLKRAGHTVPHSTVLHAVSAALNKRDWHKLKASLVEPTAAQATSQDAKARSTDIFDIARQRYSERTLFALALALACGSPVSPVPETDELALAAARGNFPAGIDGLLSWKGWNTPVTMNPLTSDIDAGDFTPETEAVGLMTLNLPGIEQPLKLEVAFSKKEKIWYLTQEGATQAYGQLQVAVPLTELFPPVMGETIRTEFWTDDRVVECEFDARPFFMQATAHEIGGIIGCGYRGDYPTDAIAQYVSDKHLDATLESGFDYIGLMQKAGREDAPGFECSVDQESMLNWLDKYRHEELAIALCEKVGYFHEEEEEFMGGVEGYAFVLAGEDYQPGAPLYGSTGAAAMVAYRELSLLEKALSNEL